MSWRQPESTAMDIASSRGALMRHLRDLARIQAFEKPLRVLAMELRIRGFDAQEEAVLGREGKTLHVEHGVVRHRQTVHREHPEGAEQRSAEHRQLERDHD